MSLARKGASVFLTNWFLLPFQIILSILIIRAIGADGKGVLALLTATVNLLATLGQLGLPVAAVYFARRNMYTERTLLINYSVAMVVVSLAIGVLAVVTQDLFIATFLKGSQVTADLIYLALASLPCLLLIAFISNLHLANGRTRQYAQINIGMNGLTVVLTFVLVILFGRGISGALTASLVSSLVFTIWAIRSVLAATPQQTSVLSWHVLKEMFKFGAAQYVGSLGAQMFKRLDSFLLALFLDVSAVGYYSVAVTGYELTLSIPRALNALLAGETSSRQETQAALLVAQTTRTVLWLTIGIVTFVAALSPWLIPLVYGPDFTQSVLPLVILLAASVLLGVASHLQTYFVGIGRPGLNGTFTLIAGLANLGFSLWLIPVAGIVGNAVATLLGAVISALLHLFWFYRLSRLSVWVVTVVTREDVMLWYEHLRSFLQRRGLKQPFFTGT